MVVQSRHTLFFFPKLIFPNKEEASNFTQLKFSLHIFGYKHVYLSPNYFIIKLSFSRGSLLNTFSRPSFSSSLEKKFLPETRSRKFVLSLSLFPSGNGSAQGIVSFVLILISNFLYLLLDYFLSIKLMYLYTYI